MSFDGFSVVTSHPDLLSFVDSQQRKNAESLSFYPMACFEREAEKGRLFLGLLNGEPAGYIYVGSGKDRVTRCHQVCIQYDARRRLYGAALVAEMEAYALHNGSSLVRLRCGFDLDANTFWSSLGYSCVSVTPGGVRRMRQINTWEKAVNLRLFDLEAVEPATGKTDATIWRKHKQTGVVTQFVRGAGLHAYRGLILGKHKSEDA